MDLLGYLNYVHDENKFTNNRTIKSDTAMIRWEELEYAYKPPLTTCLLAAAAGCRYLPD